MYLCQVSNQDRGSVYVFHHNVAYFLDVVDESDASHHVSLRISLDNVAAHIHVGVGDGLVEFQAADAVGGKLVGIHAHLEGLHLASEAHDVGNARHASQFAFYHPILQGFEFPHVVPGAREGVAEDFARRSAQGLHLGFCAFGQVGIINHVIHLLAGELIIHVVIENHGHHREAEERGASHIRLLLHGVHRNFDRDGDELFYLLRRTSLPLGDDGNLGVGYVGEGVHRRFPEAHHAQHDGKNGEADDEVFALERKRNDKIYKLIHYQKH